MAFFLCTKGVWRNHSFSYLENENFSLRIEKTLTPESAHNKDLEIDEGVRQEVIVYEIMTKNPLTVEESTPLEVLKKITKEKNIRHLPVLHDSTKVIGFISDRDLLKAEGMSTFQFLKAKDIMNTIIVLVDEDTSIAHVAKVMVEEKISAMPVINKKHEMVGIITKTDILKAVFEFRVHNSNS